MIFVGLVFKPLFNKELNKEFTEILYVSMIDIKGNVPKSLIKKFWKKGPREKWLVYENECLREDARIESEKKRLAEEKKKLEDAKKRALEA